MPRNLILLLVAHCIAQRAATAADCALDTSYLRAHAETRGFMLGRPVKAKPTPDGKAVLFLRSQARVAKLQLFEFDVATAKTRQLLTPEQVLKGGEEKLSPEEKARRERMRVSVGGFTDFQLSEDGKLILVSLSGKLYIFERSSGAVRELKTGPGTILDTKFSPDSKSVAYVRDHDVYVLDLATQQERAVTTGGTEVVTHGLAEFVAQEEMNRFTGYWWSPDSKFVAYEEADATGVEMWQVSDPLRPDQPGTPFYYPRPGKANVKLRLGVVAVPTGDDDAPRETTWIKWDAENYEYLASVRWEKDPWRGLGPFLITVQNRTQTAVALLHASSEQGVAEVRVTDRDSEWTNLDQTVPKWVGGFGSDLFFWTSEEHEGRQLELRRLGGGGEEFRWVMVPPCRGFQTLLDHEVNEDGGFVIVYRASSDPSEAHLFRQSGRFEDRHDENLTQDTGVHDAVFSADHSLYTLTSTRIDAMPKTTVHRKDGTAVGELPSAAEEPPFVPRAEIVKVGDEPDFYCAVVRPRGFDAKKRYPVINHVYGGPGHNQVLASMPTMLLRQWLADQGFIVVAIDGRGTPGRGRDWERAIAKQFGTVPLEDQVAGLKALGAKFPQMDLDRVGIVGWSFGGYMSALAVMREPDVFKAAVAGAPVVDWLDYDTHYTERYLGVPDLAADPTGGPAYREASLLTYAADLKRPLLLVHGTADDNVYFRHTLKLSDALFRAGKDFELLPLAGLTHMVPEPVVMEQLWSRIARHFQKHLGSPASP